MAHVFMARCFEVPVVVRTVAVTITGTGDSEYCYATINGTTYSAAASGIEVLAGDVITFRVETGSKAIKDAAITIDGQTVATATKDQSTTYSYTVPKDVSEILITLEVSVNSSATGSMQSKNAGLITVTTAQKKPRGVRS